MKPNIFDQTSPLRNVAKSSLCRRGVEYESAKGIGRGGSEGTKGWPEQRDEDGLGDEVSQSMAGMRDAGL